MAENDVLGQLGGFALGEVLDSFDLDSSGLSAVGLGANARVPLSRDSIYRGRFVDDPAARRADADADDDDREDYEALVDREMHDEDDAAPSTSRGGLVRGEEDDFDEDYDEEELPKASTSQVFDELPPIKQEDELPMLLPPADDFTQPLEPFDEQQDEQQPRRKKQQIRRPPTVQELFPAYESSKTLAFTELFTPHPRKRVKRTHESVKLALPDVEDLPRAKSTRDALQQPLRPPAPATSAFALLPPPSAHDPYHIYDSLREDTAATPQEPGLVAGGEQDELASVRPYEKGDMFSQLEMDAWESRVELVGSGGERALHPRDPLEPRNHEFDSGAWAHSVIWDENTPYRDFTKINYNLNDPKMLLEVEDQADNDKALVPTRRALPRVQGQGRDDALDPFNLSNDTHYQVSRDFKRRIRQTFGTLEVQHAPPAQRLQLPYYRLRLTKNEARSFHRPALSFNVHIPHMFSKVRSRKKRDKQGRKVKRNDADSLRTMDDITLRDTSEYVLTEYSEENPPILGNIGMGSVIVNYYRKRDPKDPKIPQMDLGEPFILDVNDESPFKQFGVVEPGQTVQTLYNNMYRAPLFRHKPAETDFLVVRHTVNGESRFYLRDIKNIAVVGQTYPLTEVPGPHSRKVTTLVKYRLQWIALRLVAKSPKHHIKVSKLTRYFPDQNDLQMRQRLKEFMEYNRQGEHQGWWTLKTDIAIPDEAEIFKHATPELACIVEAMEVGKRHLQDLGYGGHDEGGQGDDDSKLDVEQQLAPWITTKNFLNATSNKAMLKLHGEGDPSGRGEAFSFLRVSMKDIFLRAGETMEERLAEMAQRPKSAHRYNVQEQQDVYKEEIARIWKSQWEALSSAREPTVTEADEERYRKSDLSKQAKAGSIMAATPGGVVGTPRALKDGQSPGAEGDEDDEDQANTKALRIQRKVNGQWKTEIVRDPSIIKAYVHQRQVIEEERTDAEELLPSDDESKNAIRKKRLQAQLEKLKRNQERRLQRKNAKLGLTSGQIGLGKKAVKPETTRVCGNCGQRGHMKTSRKLCPRWHEFNAPKPTETSTSSFMPGIVGNLGIPSVMGTKANTPQAPTPTAAPQGSEAPPTPTGGGGTPAPPTPSGSGGGGAFKFKLGGSNSNAGSPPPPQ